MLCRESMSQAEWIYDSQLGFVNLRTGIASQVSLSTTAAAHDIGKCRNVTSSKQSSTTFPKSSGLSKASRAKMIKAGMHVACQFDSFDEDIFVLRQDTLSLCWRHKHQPTSVEVSSKQRLTSRKSAAALSSVCLLDASTVGYICGSDFFVARQVGSSSHQEALSSCDSAFAEVRFAAALTQFSAVSRFPSFVVVTSTELVLVDTTTSACFVVVQRVSLPQGFFDSTKAPQFSTKLICNSLSILAVSNGRDSVFLGRFDLAQSPAAGPRECRRLLESSLQLITLQVVTTCSALLVTSQLGIVCALSESSSAGSYGSTTMEFVMLVDNAASLPSEVMKKADVMKFPPVTVEGRRILECHEISNKSRGKQKLRAGINQSGVLGLQLIAECRRSGSRSSILRVEEAHLSFEDGVPPQSLIDALPWRQVLLAANDDSQKTVVSDNMNVTNENDVEEENDTSSRSHTFCYFGDESIVFKIRALYAVHLRLAKQWPQGTHLLANWLRQCAKTTDDGESWRFGLMLSPALLRSALRKLSPEDFALLFAATRRSVETSQAGNALTCSILVNAVEIATNMVTLARHAGVLLSSDDVKFLFTVMRTQRSAGHMVGKTAQRLSSVLQFQEADRRGGRGASLGGWSEPSTSLLRHTAPQWCENSFCSASTAVVMEAQRILQLASSSDLLTPSVAVLSLGMGRNKDELLFQYESGLTMTP